MKKSIKAENFSSGESEQKPCDIEKIKRFPLKILLHKNHST